MQVGFRPCYMVAEVHLDAMMASVICVAIRAAWATICRGLRACTFGLGSMLFSKVGALMLTKRPALVVPHGGLVPMSE